MKEAQERLENRVFHALTHTGKVYYAVVFILAAIVVWGMYAFSVQVRKGLIVTGMRDYISWALYIANFVFFIGISHAGTLISAILRVTHAGWRTPITRMAEFITVVALSVGALFPIIDLGRPDRILNVIQYGRFQSPITWDIIAIGTYLTGSILYLFLPLIPDLAMGRDRPGTDMPRWRRGLYRLLSVGWRGTERQKRHLHRGIGVMAILIIPIAVSVHTVVSFIFAMTLRAGWNSTMYGAYFVVGAIFSGIATIIIVMAILRKAFHLEEYLTTRHFVNLGYMLGAFAALMMYFNLLEFLVPGYKMEEGEKFLLQELLVGKYAPIYWLYIVAGLIVPVLIVLLPWTRNLKGIIAAAILVNLTMWFERVLVVIPPMRVPLLDYPAASYTPTWVEWSITAGSFAAFSLIIAIFAKLLPVISVWEVKEQMESEASKREEVVPAKMQPQRAGTGLLKR